MKIKEGGLSTLVLLSINMPVMGKVLREDALAALSQLLLTSVCIFEISQQVS